jgi:hypothetical protein
VKEQHASVPLRRSRSFECLVRSFSTNSRPALRAASGRPPARRRHDGHRGTGLTLQPRGSQSRHERPVGAHLGHAPTDSSGQPRSTTDPSACRFTCADAVDQHPARNHTVYGMQGVKARIGLAVPGRPIGPWSPRTGAPEASATGRDRSCRAVFNGLPTALGPPRGGPHPRSRLAQRRQRVQVNLTGRATGVPFTTVKVGSQRTTTDNSTAAVTCAASLLRW